MAGALLKYNGQALQTPSGAYGINNLVPENIKSGVNIGGVVGTAPSPIGNMADYTWAQIKQYADNNEIPKHWVGQMKEFLGTDGNTYHLKCVDIQVGRYQFTDDTYNHAVLEFEEIPNLTSGYGGGNNVFSSSWVYTWLNSTIYNLLPADIKAIMKEFKQRQATSSQIANTSVLTTKLSVACFSEKSMQVKTSFMQEADFFKFEKETKGFINDSLFGVWDFYKTHNTTSDMLKKLVGTETNRNYGIRGFRPQYSYNILMFYNGEINQNQMNSATGWCPCFAI